MSDEPVVSIVTPSFNQGPFLEETILSVLNQSYPRVEYHVMDGGSTDESVAVIRKHAGRLASWVSERDAGQADAINKGWARSTGEILAYLNADDQYMPGAIAAAVDLMRRHPETGILYGACCSFFPDDPAGRLYEPPVFSLKRLLLENFIPQPTVFIRREVLRKTGMLNRSLRYCLDYDLWIRAAIIGIRFEKFDGSPLAKFRLWQGSKTSGDAEGWARERLDVLNQLFEAVSPASELARMKSIALAKGYASVAYGASLTGNNRTARHFLGKAIAADPKIIGDAQFIRTGLLSLMPDRSSAAIRRLLWKNRREQRVGR
ncbi:MAG: glycosyltransferase [Candidatus Omnitrophica bacterium]|nr:glycosyltransferase [Candidatus Omnitrophota bacterium]